MDLNAAQMFVGVVQAGSLSAAAQKMNIPLPTLSRRIRELERELNVQLLERTARGTKLTDAGTRLYEHASRGVEALAEGALAVMSDQAQLKGHMRVSLPPAFEPWWELLGAFQREYPDIRLNVYTTDRRVDLVDDGIDVALRVGSIIHEDMVARHLLTYRHILVASPELLKRVGTPTSPDELHQFPCAAWCSNTSATSVWRLGDRSMEIKPQLSSNDYLHLRSRAMAGEIVTELPPFLAADAIKAGRLVSLLTHYPMPEQQINLLYPAHRHPSSIVRAYLNFCQKAFKDFVDL